MLPDQPLRVNASRQADPWSPCTVHVAIGGVAVHPKFGSLEEALEYARDVPDGAVMDITGADGRSLWLATVMPPL